MSHLRDARRASKHLSDDSEALHNFRVALRRFRTLERVFGAYFDASIGKKDMRRFRKLARASSDRRDRQAGLQLLSALADNSGWTDATAEVAAHLNDQISQTDKEAQAMAKRFKKMHRRLRRRLGHYEESIDLDELREPVTYRSVAVPIAASLADQLASALAGIQSNADEKALHLARLAAKRLRYTLEPLKAASTAVADAVLALGRLQDLLGGLRDSARLREVVLERRLEAGPSLDAEFDSLTHTLHDHSASLYAELQNVWLGGNSVSFFQGLLAALSAISPVAAVRLDLPPDPGAAQSPLPVPFSA